MKGNFNILQNYLSVLVLFKTWESYTKRILNRIVKKEDNFSESNLSESLEESK